MQPSPEQSGTGYVSGMINVSVVNSIAVPSGAANDA